MKSFYIRKMSTHIFQSIWGRALEEIRAHIVEHESALHSVHDSVQFWITDAIERNTTHEVALMMEPEVVIRIGHKEEVELASRLGFRQINCFRKLYFLIKHFSKNVQFLPIPLLNVIFDIRQSLMRVNVHCSYWAVFREATYQSLESNVPIYEPISDCFGNFVHAWVSQSLGLLTGFLMAYGKGRISPLLSENGCFRMKYVLQTKSGKRYLSKRALESIDLQW